jgi:hypothetical protein
VDAAGHRSDETHGVRVAAGDRRELDQRDRRCSSVVLVGRGVDRVGQTVSPVRSLVRLQPGRDEAAARRQELEHVADGPDGRVGAGRPGVLQRSLDEGGQPQLQSRDGGPAGSERFTLG